MDVLNTLEERQKRTEQPSGGSTSKAQIGTVEGYYEKINVAALTLTDSLMVGDIIEIGNEEEAIRQRVSSMQIDRKDIIEASEGDSVGIKVIHPVPEGADVWKIQQS
jgi:hypothetical protein